MLTSGCFKLYLLLVKWTVGSVMGCWWMGLCFGFWNSNNILVFSFGQSIFSSWLQAVATLGTYDIALELGKKVICQRY